MLLAGVLLVLLGALGFSFYEKRPESLMQLPQTNTPMGSQTFSTLNRSYQGLTKLPADILAMTNLRQLDISHNELGGALPAEIRHLKNLQILDASDNRMTGVPAEIGQLTELRTLDLSNNELTGIPHELGNLQKLELLDLSGNDISAQDIEIIRARLPKSTQVVL